MDGGERVGVPSTIPTSRNRSSGHRLAEAGEIVGGRGVAQPRGPPPEETGGEGCVPVVYFLWSVGVVVYMFMWVQGLLWCGRVVRDDCPSQKHNTHRVGSPLMKDMMRVMFPKLTEAFWNSKSPPKGTRRQGYRYLWVYIVYIIFLGD